MKKAKWWEYPTYSEKSMAEFTAGLIYERAIKKIDEREAMLQAQRDFIAVHGETLAGLHWTPALFDPAIDLSWGHYRGQKTTALDVARLWPAAKWKRVKTSFSSSLDYDWTAEVDGITLVIERAETEEPRPKLKAGERIDLGLGEVDDDLKAWECPICKGKLPGFLEEGVQCIECGALWPVWDGGAA